MKKSPAKSKRLGRLATRDNLLEALGRVLVRDGFSAVGVNAVAREAGVDKVLIYRYFGGMQELLAAFGQRENLWPDLIELTAGDPTGFARLPARDKACLLARNFLQALRNRPVAREILAWELVERNELTSALGAARDRTALQILSMLQPSAGEDALKVDLEAAQAVLTAAASYLVLHCGRTMRFAGLEANGDDGWMRIGQTIDGMLLGLLSFA
ncbi:MAG: TetR/AcrR family transcriptional regulator [Desulfovibrionaceae bacterium]